MLELSKNESEIYGLRMARGEEILKFETNELKKEILDNNFDICRLKINMKNNHVFEDLDNLGFYYETFSILGRAKLKMNQSNLDYSAPENHDFYCYDGSNKIEIEALLREGLKAKTTTTFEGELYRHLLENKEEKTIVQYYLTFNNSENSKKTMFYLKYKNVLCGCICLEFRDLFSFCTLLLVHPDYRSTGVAHELIKYAFHKSALLNMEFGGADTSFQNLPSLNAQMSYGLKLMESYLNVVLYPMISKLEEFIQVSELETLASLNLINLILAHFGLQHEVNYHYRINYQDKPSKINLIKCTTLIQTNHNKFIMGCGMYNNIKIFTIYLKFQSTN